MLCPALECERAILLPADDAADAWDDIGDAWDDAADDTGVDVAADEDEVDQPVGGADEQAAQLFTDFIHYTRVARLELAANTGKALLAMDLGPRELLAVAEGTRYQPEYVQQTIDLAQRSSGLIAEVGKQMAAAIQLITLAKTQTASAEPALGVPAHRPRRPRASARVQKAVALAKP